MQDIFIDIETYSSVDLKTCGAYKYIASPDFEILIVGYAINNGPVITVDLAQGENLPEEFEEALFDPNFRKHAHNAVFERLSFRRIGYDIPAEEWYCTSVKAAYCGLPLSLDQASKVLDLQDKKLDTGKLLIKYFSCPCKPTKVNGGRTRNYPYHAPDKWEMYKEYNRYDVLAEREIHYKLLQYDIPAVERELYVVDQAINDRGILIDSTLAKSAINIDEEYSEVLMTQAKALTHLDNPKSSPQMCKWLSLKTGDAITSLAKDVLPGLIKQYSNNPDVREALILRQKLAKSSIKKYYAMINCATPDNRVRGTFQFYGANRTGRWAGRLLQLQNLSKNHLDDIDTPRDLVRAGDWDAVEMLYDDVPDILSQLVRTAIVAPKGKILAVCDFSAIEARVISWLAEEDWRMDVFRGDGKIYEAAGARMFNVPISAITKTSPLRQKAKIAELALGYQGHLGAMKRMGGENMGLSDAEMTSIVRKWRDANPKIVELWAEVEDCAMEAVRYQRQIVGTSRDLIFDCNGEVLTITLPSGRSLFYRNPHIKQKAKGRTAINSLFYEGLNQETKQWTVLDTYGGKLVENIVQAIARDLLAFSLINLHKDGYAITMHVHDEIIAEIAYDGSEQEVYNRMASCMGKAPDWASDLPLNADGYLTLYYKKD